MTAPRSIQQRWHTLRALIDSRSLRERALLFFTAIAMAYVICHFALFNPLRAYQDTLQKRLSADQADLAALHKQTEEILAKTREDPDMPNRQRLAELTRQLGEADAPVAELMKSLVSPREMAALVKDVLSTHRQLNVVSLVNLPPEPVAAKTAAQGAEPVSATPAIYKHGLRIEFKGTFRDIVEFFRALEGLSWKVLWAEADIKTEHYPESTATVTVYTLSTDEAWISL